MSQTDDAGHTPATSSAPEGAAEGDSNQLTQDDTLLDRGVEDVLDEGYSPPDHPPNPHRLETEAEQQEGESLEDRLAQEEPEVWESTDTPDAGAREADRAGRLAPGDPESTGESTSSLMAEEVGIAGGAASAEEAAVHVVDESADPADTP